MRWLAVFALAGCDSVFGLERPPPGQFCLQPAVANVELCSDFDDPLDTDPLAAFIKADSRGEYSAESEGALSQPFAARLRIAGTGSLDARLQYSAAPASTFDVAFSFHVVEATPSQAIKVVSLSYGPRTNGISNGALYLTTEGRIIQRLNATNYQQVTQINALPTGRWVHVDLTVDLVANSGTVAVDAGSAKEFDFEQVDDVQDGDRILSIGPHDPEPTDAVAWTMLLDDVVIR